MNKFSTATTQMTTQSTEYFGRVPYKIEDFLPSNTYIEPIEMPTRTNIDVES